MESAIPDLQRAIELQPDLATAYLYRMTIARYLGEDDVYRQLAGQVAQRFPADYELHWETMHAAMPKWGGSMAQLATEAQWDDAHAQANPLLGVLRAVAYSYPATDGCDCNSSEPPSEAVLRRAVALGSYRVAMLKLAKVTASDGRWWEAMAWLSQVIRFFPENVEARQARAEAIQLHLHDENLERRDLVAILAVDPGNFATIPRLGELEQQSANGASPTQWLASALAQPGSDSGEVWIRARAYAEVLARHEHYDQALPLLTAVFKAEPQNVHALFALGQCQRLTGDPVAAKSSLQQFLALTTSSRDPTIRQDRDFAIAIIARLKP